MLLEREEEVLGRIPSETRREYIKVSNEKGDENNARRPLMYNQTRTEEVALSLELFQRHGTSSDLRALSFTASRILQPSRRCSYNGQALIGAV